MIIDQPAAALPETPKGKPAALRVEQVPMSEELKADIARNIAIGRHGSAEAGHIGDFESCQHAVCAAWRIPAPALPVERDRDEAAPSDSMQASTTAESETPSLDLELIKARMALLDTGIARSDFAAVIAEVERLRASAPPVPAGQREEQAKAPDRQKAEVALRVAAIEFAALGAVKDSRDSAGMRANRKLLRAAARYVAAPSK